MRTGVFPVAKWSFILTIALLQNGYACSPGYMEISAAATQFSCQKLNLVEAAPVPLISSEDCPAGSVDSDAIGALDPCKKTYHGQVEIVLRAGDRCPVGYSRFLDGDGADACRLPTGDSTGDDAGSNGF